MPNSGRGFKKMVQGFVYKFAYARELSQKFLLPTCLKFFKMQVPQFLLVRVLAPPEISIKTNVV